MQEYYPILWFFLVAVILAFIIVGASYLFAVKNPDPEKVSVYECGFDPYGDSRQKFEVRFFLIGILFIIFDLEISFLFPWSIVLMSLPVFGYWTMYLFLFILTVGLFYEWNKGGLEWE
jgi:NADH:ubiquinone oxidoreductase subunit 3 (subunit A)